MGTSSLDNSSRELSHRGFSLWGMERQEYHVGRSARDIQRLHRRCARYSLKTHSFSLGPIVPAGVVAPVDVVRHGRHGRFSNRHLGGDPKGVSESSGISHRGHGINSLDTTFVRDDDLNECVCAVTGVTDRLRRCDCHYVSWLGTGRTHGISGRKTGRLVAERAAAPAASHQNTTSSSNGDQGKPPIDGSLGIPGRECHVPIVVPLASTLHVISKFVPISWLSLSWALWFDK